MPKRAPKEDRKRALDALIFTADDMAIEWADAMDSRQGLEGKTPPRADREKHTSTIGAGHADGEEAGRT